MARAKSSKAEKQIKKHTVTPEPTHLTNRQIVDLQVRLDLVHDVMSTVVAALEAENIDHEPDFARVLRAHGMDQIFNIIVELDQITHHFDYRNEP